MARPFLLSIMVKLLKIIDLPCFFKLSQSSEIVYFYMIKVSSSISTALSQESYKLHKITYNSNCEVMWDLLYFHRSVTSNLGNLLT